MGDILKIKGEQDIGVLIISIIISVGMGILSSAFAGIPRISYENFIWPLIFFKWDLKAVDPFQLLVLIGFIIIIILEFLKFDKKAAYLLIPYLLWSIFATLLNYSIWMLNV